MGPVVDAAVVMLGRTVKAPNLGQLGGLIIVGCALFMQLERIRMRSAKLHMGFGGMNWTVR